MKWTWQIHNLKLKADMVEIAQVFYYKSDSTYSFRKVGGGLFGFFSPKNSLNSRKAENEQLSCQAPLQHIYWSSCRTHILFWFCPCWVVQCYSLLCTSFWNGYRDVWARSTVSRHWINISTVFSGTGAAPPRWRGLHIYHSSPQTPLAKLPPHFAAPSSSSPQHQRHSWTCLCCMPYIFIFFFSFSNKSYAALGMIISVWIEWEHLTLSLITLLYVDVRK